MKRIALGVVLTAALALAPASLASGSLVGKFKSVQSTGTWVLQFKTGSYKAYDNGSLRASGADAVSGDHVTLYGCLHAPGKYKFKLTATTLTFTEISDTCDSGNRAKVLLHTWKKIS